MTHDEWNECQSPEEMLGWLRQWGKLTDRKTRLFAVACVRSIWHLLEDERSRRGIEHSEWYADQPDDAAGFDEDVSFAAAVAFQVVEDVVLQAATLAASYAAVRPSSGWLRSAWQEVTRALEGQELERQGLGREALEAWSEQCSESGRALGWTEVDVEAPIVAMIRDIFNPFPTAKFDPAWRSDPVVLLAAASYETRTLPAGHLDPARLAVLADALQDAGCNDAELLSHLRSPGPHVRGCWAIDTILGRD